MSEAEYSLESYPTLGQLFARKLKLGKRPIHSGVIHPCDAKLTQGGPIQNEQLIQAKGKYYTLQKFLANQDYWSEFKDGHYLTYYLCPTDYHRVHSPVSGKIVSCTHVPGRLWPVNEWSVQNISELFSVNERTLTLIETERGKLLIVMVGATNVGKISMSFDDDILTNQSHFSREKTNQYTPSVAVEKGAELGVFHMGSTVVVLATPGFFERLPAGYSENTRMGESLKFKEI